jgi:hypothetical protein
MICFGRRAAMQDVDRGEVLVLFVLCRFSSLLFYRISLSLKSNSEWYNKCEIGRKEERLSRELYISPVVLASPE